MRLIRRRNDLRRELRAVLTKLGKATNRIIRISGMSVTEAMMRNVESKVNAEGYMERIIERRFRAQSEHGPGSTKWAALAKSTIKRKGSSRILIDTTEMYQGAIEAVTGTFKVRQLPNWNVEDVGVDYAVYHQTGTDRMPARPFFDRPTAREMEPAKKRAMTLLRAELRKQVRKAS